MLITYIQKHLVTQTAFEQDENYTNDHLFVLFEYHIVQQESFCYCFDW